MNSQGKTLMKRTLLFLIYGLAGAGVFTFLEKRDESNKVTSTKMLQQLKKNLTMHRNMTDEEFEVLAVAAYRAIRVRKTRDWSYFRAVDFTYSALTTIGYGHITPVTTPGKIFCVVFCLFGIPLCLLTLKCAGELISNLMSSFIINFERTVFHSQFVNCIEIKCAILTFTLMVAFLSFGSVIQVVWEKWTFVDAFYAWFITFTTVGFGDYIPFDSVISRQDSLKAAIFHIFGTFPAIFGLCLVASVIDALIKVFAEGGMDSDSHNCFQHINVYSNVYLEGTKTDKGYENMHFQYCKRSHSI
ncbi:two pore potassium channel protein sup-9-like isoform X2 [Montipora capricornis]